MEIDIILPPLERITEIEGWETNDTLVYKYHRALIYTEKEVEELLDQVTHVENLNESLDMKIEILEESKLALEVVYLKNKLMIIEPALEVLTTESREMYDAELEELDKKYKL